MRSRFDKIPLRNGRTDGQTDWLTTYVSYADARVKVEAEQPVNYELHWIECARILRRGLRKLNTGYDRT